MPGDKLYPVHVSVASGKPSGSTPNAPSSSSLAHFSAHVSLGGLGDSFYEYIIKYYVLTKGKADHVGKWFFAVLASFILPSSHLTAFRVATTHVQIGDAVLDILGASFEDSFFVKERFGATTRAMFDHLVPKTFTSLALLLIRLHFPLQLCCDGVGVFYRRHVWTGSTAYR